MAAELARNCSWNGQQKNNVITLSLDAAQEQLHTDATEEKLKTALEQYFSKSIKLSIVVQQSAADSINTLQTPAQKMERDAQERQRAAEQEIYNDPFVKALQERFDAQIVEGSIKPIDNEVK